jgi:hypothetical protein
LRRNVVVGGLLGGLAALAASAGRAYQLLPGDLLGATTAALLVLGSATLYMLYSREGRGRLLEALAAELLAFIFLAPPLYTLFLRIAGGPE